MRLRATVVGDVGRRAGDGGVGLGNRQCPVLDRDVVVGLRACRHGVGVTAGVAAARATGADIRQVGDGVAALQAAGGVARYALRLAVVGRSQAVAGQRQCRLGNVQVGVGDGDVVVAGVVAGDLQRRGVGAGVLAARLAADRDGVASDETTGGRRALVLGVAVVGDVGRCAGDGGVGLGQRHARPGGAQGVVVVAQAAVIAGAQRQARNRMEGAALVIGHVLARQVGGVACAGHREGFAIDPGRREVLAGKGRAAVVGARPG